MSRIRLVLLAFACMGVVACSITQEDLVASFSAANPGATEAQANCVVDQLIVGYGIDGLEAELAAEPDSEEFTQAQFRAMIRCGMTDALTDQLASQMSQLDVPKEAQDCVVSELTDDITEADLDVLVSGELTDDYYAKFFDALSACDALP